MFDWQNKKQDGNCKLRRAQKQLKQPSMQATKGRKRLEEHHNLKEQIKNATTWTEKRSIVNYITKLHTNKRTDYHIPPTYMYTRAQEEYNEGHKLVSVKKLFLTKLNTNATIVTNKHSLSLH